MGLSTHAGRKRHWLPRGVFLSLALLLFFGCKAQVVNNRPARGTNSPSSTNPPDPAPVAITNTTTFVTVTNPVGVSVTNFVVMPSNPVVWVTVSNAAAGPGGSSSNFFNINASLNCTNCGGGGGGKEQKDSETWTKLLFKFLSENFKEIIELITSLVGFIGAKKVLPTGEEKTEKLKNARFYLAMALFLVSVLVLGNVVRRLIWPSYTTASNYTYITNSDESVLAKLDQQQTSLSNILNAQAEQAALLNDYIRTNRAAAAGWSGGDRGSFSADDGSNNISRVELRDLYAKLDGLQNSLSKQALALSNHDALLTEIKRIAEEKAGSGPTILAKISAWLTIVTVLAGGFWAVWVFYYEARGHTPSLDGELSVESTVLWVGKKPLHGAPSSTKDFGPAHLVVTVRGLWNNRSKFPLKLDPDMVAVHAYIIPETLGPFTSEIENLTNLKNVDVRKPYRDKKTFTLEPNTKSTLAVHFVLEKGPVYLFHWELESLKGNRWYKEIIWNSSVDPSEISTSHPPGSVPR